jgi:hypothetical protein
MYRRGVPTSREYGRAQDGRVRCEVAPAMNLNHSHPAGEKGILTEAMQMSRGASFS